MDFDEELVKIYNFKTTTLSYIKEYDKNIIQLQKSISTSFIFVNIMILAHENHS